MDLLEYKDVFVSEVKEHLQTLDNLLVHLEKNPKDKDVIIEALRLMHSIKGSAGMMGYTEISKLAHEAENILIDLRDEKMQITSEVIDRLLGYVDKIRGLIELEEQQDASIKSSEGVKGVKVKMKLKVDDPLKPIRAFMILRVLAECGDVVSTTPPTDQLAQGQFDDTVEAELIVDDPQKVKDSLSQIPDIVEVQVEVKEDIVAEKASLAGAISLSDKIHQIDELVSFVEESEARSGAATISDKFGEHRKLEEVKVNVKNLDTLFNLIGELVLTKARLNSIATRMDSSELRELMLTLERLVSDMQSEIMAMRLVPLRQVFNTFPRVIRDIAKELGKEVDFVITGGEIAIDRKILEEIVDPLIHIVRNAIDHGIEDPETRRRKGKPPVGTIKISARKESNYVVIQIEDDGKGIDPNLVKRVAVEKGFISKEAAEKLTDEEAIMLICLPGFSTRDEASSLSGRGVGMNVVKDKVEALGGNLTISSEVDKGTVVSLRLPSSMATLKALIVDIEGSLFAIPIVDVECILKVPRREVKNLHGNLVMIYRGEAIPLFDFKGSENPHDDYLVVVVKKTSNQLVGMTVSSILGEEEIVVKQLPRMLRGIKGISGATILGDGRVGFIMDTATFLH